MVKQPYWPSIICIHPQEGTFHKLRRVHGKQRMRCSFLILSTFNHAASTMHYWVKFLPTGDHQWIAEKFMSTFMNKDLLRKTLNEHEARLKFVLVDPVPLSSSVTQCDRS